MIGKSQWMLVVGLVSSLGSYVLADCSTRLNVVMENNSGERITGYLSSGGSSGFVVAGGGGRDVQGVATASGLSTHHLIAKLQHALPAGATSSSAIILIDESCAIDLPASTTCAPVAALEIRKDGERYTCKFRAESSSINHRVIMEVRGKNGSYQLMPPQIYAFADGQVPMDALASGVCFSDPDNGIASVQVSVRDTVKDVFVTGGVYNCDTQKWEIRY